MICKKVFICFVNVSIILQILGCNDQKIESNDNLLNYFVSAGLMLNDSQAHDALVGGEIAVNNVYDATPKPDQGTRIAGSITTMDGIIIDYDWCIDTVGNWSPPSTLNLSFDSYYVDLFFENAEADGIELNGSCRVDISGGATLQSLQKRIRHKIQLFLYYHPQPGSTHVIGAPAQSDYAINESFSPEYSKCYTGSFAGRNVIPLIEPRGDGCLE